MAVVKDADQPHKNKTATPSESEDDKRRKKMVPGGLMKAMIRPGGGDSMPSDGDQVSNLNYIYVSVSF